MTININVDLDKLIKEKKSLGGGSGTINDSGYGGYCPTEKEDIYINIVIGGTK